MCPADRNVANQIEFSVPILNSFPIVEFYRYLICF